MKVLTAVEMREVDRRTIEAGIPGIVLMENAAHRVVEFLAQRFAPLASQRIVALCGKGNNGGDGLAIARYLHTVVRPSALYTVLFAKPEDLQGDAAVNFRMLQACGCEVSSQIPAAARCATLVVDALLGTGLSGPATGPALDGIREINIGFPLAKVVAVDLPSGMPSDSGAPLGECARADYTVTFTAPKIAHAMPPNCDRIGELLVAQIGSRAEFMDGATLSLIEPHMFQSLLLPRDRAGHKGTYGHALIVAGSHGKTGAAAMAGLGALRAGAGLVTVASDANALAGIGSHAPELMMAALSGNLAELAAGKAVIAIGPGFGRTAATEALVKQALELEQPLVLDADALSPGIEGSAGRTRVLTPHPGEMARIAGVSTEAIQRDRIAAARAFATERRLTLVLKGERTLLAFSDGRVWINPSGTPAMGTGGTGDVLTGLIAGLLAQFPSRPDEAVAAAVYLHGLAGQLGARALGEKCLIATDLLHYLSPALLQTEEACGRLSHAL